MYGFIAQLVEHCTNSAENAEWSHKTGLHFSTDSLQLWVMCAEQHEVACLDLCRVSSVISSCLVTLGLAQKFGFDSTP